MKTLTCAQMGGPCQTAISGNDLAEISQNGMKHLQAAHPEMTKDMENMSEADNAAWGQKIQAMLDAQA